MSETSTLKDKFSEYYQTNQPQAKWLTMAGVIAAIFILGIIFYGFILSGDGDNTESLIADKTSVRNKKIKLDQAKVLPKTGMMHDIEKKTETDIVIENNKKIDTNKQLSDQNTEQIASIENLLKKMQSQINRMPEEYQQHGVEIQTIHSQLVSLKSGQKKLKKALPKKVTPAKIKRRYRPRPAFKLVSIDIWGSDESIIVRHENQLHDLTLGQSIGNWQVDSIDINGARVIFRNKYGVKQTLFIES
jgi:hypothetical protein